jgi:phage tail sheath protein FI
MAQETLISPGVLTRENDLSQITQLPPTVGLALVGPTVKGKPYIPTVVTSYSDYKNRFGGSFVSSGSNYEFLTSITAYNYFQQGGTSILVTRVTSGSYTAATSSLIRCSGSEYATSASFVLETINVGTMNNNTGTILSNGALSNGTMDNVRWEVSNVNCLQGTFTVLVRRGDDNTNSKSVLETYTNVSLDPLQPNYIAAVIGDQSKTVAYDSDMGGYYIQVSGSYPNNSRYVRVKSVQDTPNYFTNAGTVAVDANALSYSGSLPLVGSGSAGGAFGTATGNDIGNCSVTLSTTLFQNNSATLPQGIPVANYATASNILSNKDEYDYEILATPGLQHVDHATAQTNFITNAENRGDHFYIMDLTAYNASIGTPVTEAQEMDTNYAGAYWPWVQVLSPETGRNVWVPASTIMPSVYAFNDNVSAEWFAPAGLNRGGLGGVIQAERKLSPINRDNLYAGKVNPIATFPNVGVTAFGQKTLQQKASALDRINVRRLLIALKRYIGNVGKTLIFEQNTTVTRNRFLSQVTPYLESVQQKQGLYAFKVVMDDTNNTPDVIDRNQLVGQIYLQPTRTAEFILLDFNVMPTGVEFGA